MKPGQRGTQSPHTEESVMKLKSHDSQYRSSPPELLAFHLAAQEVGEYAELLGQGQRHLVLVIDSVRKGNSSLLNLKNINM